MWNALPKFSIDSGKGLVPSGSKPLPKPMLTKFYGVKWHHQGSMRLRQNGCHFTDDPFKCIFLSETVRISIDISLKFVPKDQINNIPALVQIMVWCQPGNKPSSEPMVVRSPMHICITLPQWVNSMSQFWPIVNWTLGNKFQWNFNRYSTIFIQENTFENVVCQNGSHFVQGEMS